MQLELQSYGERAVLIQSVDEDLRSHLVDCLEVDAPKGVVESVFGYSTMLLIFESFEFAANAGAWLARLPDVNPQESSLSRLVEVPVIYDGVDLEEVARMSHLPVPEVVKLHSAPEYRVRMMGFSPGFPYLDGLDARLHIDRRASPRNYIEPGAVAIGGAHAGIYSVGSPGGWHLLGRTEMALFRPECAQARELRADAIFALAPGDRVKFINVS